MHQVFGEILHVQHPGETDQSLHVVGSNFLRADQGGAVQCLEQLLVFQIFPGLRTGNSHRDLEQGIGNLASHQVGFIAVGQRHQHFGVAGIRLLQNRRMGSVALDQAQVCPGADLIQQALLLIDQGDLVPFLCQRDGERGANLSGTEDDDLHEEEEGFPLEDFPLRSPSSCSLRYRYVRSMPVREERCATFPSLCCR